MDKNSVDRYNNYYERQATNESSREKALSDLQQMQAVQIEKLSDRQGQVINLFQNRNLLLKHGYRYLSKYRWFKGC